MPQTETVLIVGASDKPERYAHKAMLALEAHGHRTVLVHPRLTQIDDRPVLPDLASVTDAIDTVTLYINPTLSTPMKDALIALRPRRVLFNPGTENPDLATALQAAGIQTEEACTLVLLATHSF